MKSIKVDAGDGSILCCTFLYIYNGWGPIGVYFHLFPRWKSMLKLSWVALRLLCCLLLVNLAFHVIMFNSSTFLSSWFISRRGRLFSPLIAHVLVMAEFRLLGTFSVQLSVGSFWTFFLFVKIRNQKPSMWLIFYHINIMACCHSWEFW